MLNPFCGLQPCDETADQVKSPEEQRKEEVKGSCIPRALNKPLAGEEI